jgi:hypothetical protein
MNITPSEARTRAPVHPHRRVRAGFLNKLCLAALVFGVSLAQATTVVPPDFDSLVKQADYVVRGVVKSVNSEWRASGENRAIFTKVEIDVREVIAGEPPRPLVLDILGGRVGKDEMTLHGSPVFQIGEEAILFIHGNGVQIHPLVALRHGHYPIKKHDDGAAHVARSDGQPLHDEREISLAFSHASSPSSESTAGASKITSTTLSALSPEEFARRIRHSRAKAAAATTSPNEK